MRGREGPTHLGRSNADLHSALAEELGRALVGGCRSSSNDNAVRSSAGDALHLGRDVRARLEVDERFRAEAKAHVLLFIARVDPEDAKTERFAVLGACAGWATSVEL